MRGGGSMPGVPVGAAEKGCTLTGVAAAGPAVPIDAVCAGAASSTRLASCEASTGAETGGRLTGGGSAGSGVAADAVWVGTASSDERLGPEAVVHDDARGKRCEERHGHNECRFHRHGELSSVLPKES